MNLRDEIRRLRVCQMYVRQRLDRPLPGHVYFVQVDNGRLKIGQTGNLPQRMDSLEREFGDQIFRVHAIRTDQRTLVEQYYHLLFKDRHLGHEIFELTVADIDAKGIRKVKRLSAKTISPALLGEMEDRIQKMWAIVKPAKPRGTARA